MAESDTNQPLDFIRAAVTEDLKTGRYNRVHTRFPPEPNGYLHIGHAKAICLDFGIAAEFGGTLQPALRRHQPRQGRGGVRRLHHRRTSAGWASTGRTALFYASDYFEQLYEWAVQLIRKGKAYVCDLSADEIREYRGTLTEPGKEQPVPQPLRGGEPGPVRAHAGRRVPRRRAHAARQDRHGLAQHEPARPGDVPHPARHAPPHRRHVVHLSDVRLRPRPVATPSRGSPTRSARWSTRTTARCTTGSSTSWASTTRARSSSRA